VTRIAYVTSEIGLDDEVDLVYPALGWEPVIWSDPAADWASYSLAIRFKDDYARANIPMLPVVATPQAVARRVVAYSWAMVLTSVLLALDGSGAVYVVSALVLGAVFLREAHVLESRVRTGAAFNPMRLFHFSITYLALLFLAVAVDQLV
jgi:protoheme IX farnesyltransferase